MESSLSPWPCSIWFYMTDMRHPHEYKYFSLRVQSFIINTHLKYKLEMKLHTHDNGLSIPLYNYRERKGFLEVHWVKINGSCYREQMREWSPLVCMHSSPTSYYVFLIKYPIRIPRRPISTTKMNEKPPPWLLLVSLLSISCKTGD